jgi:hypothetical protein
MDTKASPPKKFRLRIFTFVKETISLCLGFIGIYLIFTVFMIIRAWYKGEQLNISNIIMHLDQSAGMMLIVLSSMLIFYGYQFGLIKLLGFLVKRWKPNKTSWYEPSGGMFGIDLNWIESLIAIPVVLSMIIPIVFFMSSFAKFLFGTDEVLRRFDSPQVLFSIAYQNISHWLVVYGIPSTLANIVTALWNLAVGLGTIEGCLALWERLNHHGIVDK